LQAVTIWFVSAGGCRAHRRRRGGSDRSRTAGHRSARSACTRRCRSLRNGHTHEDAALPAVLSPHLSGRHQGVGQCGSGQVGRLPRGCGRTQAGLDPARHRRLRQHDQYAFHTSIIGTDPRASARRSATVRCCWTRTSWSSTDPCGPSSDATPTSRPPGCHGERITVLGTDRVWTPGIPVAERGRHQCASSRAGLERRSGRVGRPG
jgi:hypothetical protein